MHNKKKAQFKTEPLFLRGRKKLNLFKGLEGISVPLSIFLNTYY